MRPGQQQQQNKQRMRGRGRKGPNPLSRSYESNGPDVKIRGTAQHVAEKYLTLARDASASGDRVMAENYLQHAEHYGRIVAAAQGSFQAQRDEREVEYDEDGEEIFEEGGQNGVAQPDAPQPQPQMRENRDGGQQRENGQNGQRDTYQRESRDGQNGQNRENRNNRDGNRDYQNRGDRDQNRDYQNRDGNPARDPQAREGQNRDGQNRDGQNRDGQPRDGQSRDGQPRENRGNREFNRENRGERNREFRQNRDQQGDQQGERAAQAAVPSGLGPQPFIVLPPAAQSFEPASQPSESQADLQPAVPMPSTVEAPAQIQGDLPLRGENEPRRRGRPRRVRSDEVETVSAASAAPEPVAAAAPVEAPPVEAPAAEAVAPVSTGGDAPEGEVKAKRRPGRPRKKKADDEGSEEGGDHLPAFLMASNG